MAGLQVAEALKPHSLSLPDHDLTLEYALMSFTGRLHLYHSPTLVWLSYGTSQGRLLPAHLLHTCIVSVLGAYRGPTDHQSKISTVTKNDLTAFGVLQVVEALRPHGLTLQNFASIREQTLGGFTQAGCHGTGARTPPVDEQVVAMKLVTPAKGSLELSPVSSMHPFKQTIRSAFHINAHWLLGRGIGGGERAVGAGNRALVSFCCTHFQPCC